MYTKSILPAVLMLSGKFLVGGPGDCTETVGLKISEESIASLEAYREPAENLTLSKALVYALTRNPNLAAFSQEIRAREAAVLQAGLLPNPTLAASAENLGNRTMQGFDGELITLQLSQLVELGGKRAARTQAAQANKDLGDWDYEIQRIEVLTGVAKSFVEVLSSQARLDLARQTADLAKQVSAAVSNQVEAGKVSPVEKTRSEVALASVQIHLTRVERELEAARSHLSAFWGSTEPRFLVVLGELEAVSPIPTLEQLTERLQHNPELARWSTELKQRQAVVNFEKANAVPNLTVSLGVQHFLDPDDYSLVAGISVPLPLFNRNQGGVLEAEHRRSKANDESRAAQVRITTALNRAYQVLTTAHSEVETYKTSVLPGAESAFKIVQKGYRLGKFPLLDVLDTQRTLVAAKAQYIRSLTTYHQAVADLERLTGTHISGESR